MSSKLRLSGRTKLALKVFFLTVLGTLLFIKTPLYERAELAYFDFQLRSWLQYNRWEGITAASLFQYQERTRTTGFDDEQFLELLNRLEMLGVAKVYIFETSMFQDFPALRSKLPSNVRVFDTHEATGSEKDRQILFLDTPDLKLSDLVDADGSLRALPWDHPAVEFARDIAASQGVEFKPRGERLYLKPATLQLLNQVSAEYRGEPLDSVMATLERASSESDVARLRELYAGRVIFIEQATLAATRKVEIPTGSGDTTAGDVFLQLLRPIQEGWTLVELEPPVAVLVYLLIVGGTTFFLSGRKPLMVAFLGTVSVAAVIGAGSRLLSLGYRAPMAAILFGQALALLILVFLEVARGRQLLKKFGGAEDAQFEGEESEASMVFTILPDYLLEMERNHDENLLVYRREYNEVLALIAKNYHGKVLDYQGDAQMLGFGLRKDDDVEHPAEATAAALEIVEAVSQLAERWKAPAEKLKVHAGVCTGSIALGHLGAKQKQDIAAIGDTTNTAARLMGAAMKQKVPVLVAKSTYVAAEGLVRGKSLPPVELKGKSAPVEVYRADSVDEDWKVRNRAADKESFIGGGTIEYRGHNQEDLFRTVAFGGLGFFLALNLWADDSMERSDRFVQDFVHRTVGLVDADPRIIIFGIDESSTADARLGRFPWNRGVYAKIINNLKDSGHEALFLDIMFKRARKDDPEGDAEFAEALRNSPRTVLAGALYRNETFRFADPLLFPAVDSELMRERHQIGLIHVARGNDGMARHAFLTAQETASHDSGEAHLRKIYPSAAAAMLLKPGDRLGFEDERSKVRLGDLVVPAHIDDDGKSTVIVRFGPASTSNGLPPQPNSYKLVSVNRLLDPNDSIFDELDGKYLLIGQNLTTGDLNNIDRINTVVGEIKGVEVHARLLDCLLNENYLRPMPWGDRLTLYLLVSGLTLLILTRYRHAKSYVPMLVGLAASVSLFEMILFLTAGIVTEFVTPLVFMAIVCVSVLVSRYILTYRALTMVIPAEVATELLYHHSTQDRRQEATILLTDIRGYTTLSEGRTAVAMLDVLNEYHKRTVACYERYGGQALTYQGDAQIVVFGVFGNRKNPAADGVAAALGLQAICDQLREEWGIESRDDFDVGAGLCTGEVEVGLLGGGTNMQYSVVGETVRKAHKVQSLSADLEAPVILDEETYQATKGAVVVDDLGMIQPKGLPHEIRLYRAKSVPE